MSGPVVHHMLEKYVDVLYYGEEPVQEVSKKMRQTIEDEAQNLPSQMFSSLISRMVESGISLLTYDPKDSQYRKVGLVVLDCLLDVSDELMPERRIEIANQLRNVLENEKQNIETNADVLRFAAASIGHLARVASTTEIEFLQDFYVTNSIKWLSDTRSEAHRFSGLLILAQLAINSPALIFAKRKEYFKAIWDVVCDRNQMIREAAASSLQAALILVSQRDTSNDYNVITLQQVELGFASNFSEKVHGSMLLFDCLLNENVVPFNTLNNTIRARGSNIHDLFWEVLQRKDHRDLCIKLKVLELIPKMAAASPSSYLQVSTYLPSSNFLRFSIKHLLLVIQNGKDRSAAYVSLGGLFTSLSSPLKVTQSHIIDDVFAAIKEGLKEPFCIEALQCLGVVVKSSEMVREYVDSTLINGLFQGGLTSELIKALKIIVKSTPSIRGEVQAKLRSQITHILLNRSVTSFEGEDRPRAATAGGNSRRGSLTPIVSSSSLLMSFWTSSKPTAASSRLRSVSQQQENDNNSANDNELVLALQVLASFDFLPSKFVASEAQGKVKSNNSRNAKIIQSSSKESEMLLRVVREGVVRYLDDSNPAIRDAAAVTCAKVLEKVVDVVESSADCDKYLMQVMDRLLMLGVGDESESIRAHVFQSLPPSLDHVISTSQNVHCLIEAMNDESFDVRAAAMSVLSRVAHYDTVHIMPLVRLVLSKLMRQLHNSKDQLLRQENVQLLQAMVRGTNVLIVPYVKQVIEPLLMLLDDPSSAIVGAALSTIGELSLASPRNIRIHLPELFPRLIQALNDHSSIVKQEIAVVALGKIISALILPYHPCTQYPTLFGSIVRVIQRTEVSALSLKVQAIKTAGLLGAVDAETYQRSLRSNSDNKLIATISSEENFSLKINRQEENMFRNNETPLVPIEDEEDDVLMTSDKYYLFTVMKALMNILRDSSLSSHHQAASTVAIRITRILGYQVHLLLDDLVDGITYRYKNCEAGSALQEALIDHLVTLVFVVGRDIFKYVDTIVGLVCESYSIHLNYCLDLIEAFCYIMLPQDFVGILRVVLPPMLQVMRNELLSDDELLVSRSDLTNSSSANRNGVIGAKRSTTPLANTTKILTTISNISPNLGEYRRQLIPVVLKVMEQTGVRASTRREALCTVMHLALDSEDLNEFASRIILPILRLLLSTETILQTAALTALSFMVCRLKNLYLPFIIPAKRKTAQLVQKDVAYAKPMQLEEYESLVALLLGQRPLPSEPSKGSSINIKNDRNLNNRLEGAKNIQHALRVEYKALDTASALSERHTASDLVEWMRRLSIEVIRQSPSPILRHCAALAKVYKPLAHELFNAAFISVWDELYAQSDSEIADIPLTRSLENALRSNQIPGNIRDALLNLAEFMEMQDKPLPIDVLLLAEQSKLANMFAKCLHYRELEFNCVNTLPSTKCIEALIIVNDQLGMREAANGVLQCVRLRYNHISIEPLWLEKLNRWEDAKDAYLKQTKEWRMSKQTLTASQYEKWMASELGLLRCLHALGEYKELTTSALDLKSNINIVEVVSTDIWMSEVQKLGANAAWMLGEWDSMGGFLEDGSLAKMHDIQLQNDGSFYQAVLAIHKNDFSKANRLINDAREAMTTSISSILNESYSRAYRSMVTMQVLSEMEEIIDYKISTKKICNGLLLTEKDISIFYNKNKKYIENNKPDLIQYDYLGNDGNQQAYAKILYQISVRRSILMTKWKKRLNSAPREVDVYRLILGVHTLLVEPKDDLDSWLELVSLTRKEGMLFFCDNILRHLGAPLKLHNAELNSTSIINDSNAHPLVIFNTYKYWWDKGDYDDALTSLTSFIKQIDSNEDIEVTEATYLKVQCLLKRAEWLRILHDNSLTDEQRSDVLATVQEARELASDQYSVWHAWAVTNYDQVTNTISPTVADGRSDTPLSQRRSSYMASNYGSKYSNGNVSFVVEAIRGFIRSITLGGNQPVANLLQDTLSLLTLWFTYGTNERVYEILSSDLDSVSAENWLGVLPQLIARMHVKSPEISILLKKLLVKVAVSHPQALVCPISVASNTTNLQRRQIATDVMLEMKIKYSQLVEEASVVSKELMRVAITPHELWHEGLERAAQFYIAQKDEESMLETLTDLHLSMHDMLPPYNIKCDPSNKDTENIFESNPDNFSQFSLRDVSFRHCYGRDLELARLWLEKYRVSRDAIHLHQAWDLYQLVFKQISSQLKSFKTLELRHVSPALTGAIDMNLAVPGSYRPRGELINIRGFSPSVDIISSKQRPRRMTILGSDGLEYRFLLKGHEDLRQDERVMQLFGLINVFLENDGWTRSRGLNIVRYSVLPLSNNSGVIGWVENCDTLNQLVKQYREAHDIKMNVELRLLQSKAFGYEKLTLQQKVDVFSEVLSETTGSDLAKMLWFKSKTSDIWVERRANYTKSLAVMSIVGYILGLGDRHPSNLMLDRIAGRIVHIDFGDCFDVARQRTKFPETVPFRLTRMLIKAMETSGIEGTFRTTSEKVMSILRKNRDSVMAMLEAFVYDPLISWRLLAQNDESITTSTATTAGRGQNSGTAFVSQVQQQFQDVPLEGSEMSRIVNKELIPDESGPQRLVRVSTSNLQFEEQLNHFENPRAIEVIERIQSKLTGRDFSKQTQDSTVEQQVDMLIQEATSVENLCQIFIGWCPFW